MDISLIHESLAQGPQEIYEAAVEVGETRTALDQAKRNAEKARAMATINHQNAKNQTILSALVENDSAVCEAEASIIAANGAYLAALARHEKAKAGFDAAKKEANLMPTEMSSFSSQRHQ